jgi:Ribbon-helix-helix domain
MTNVRWNLAVPENVDRSVRIFLAERGGKKGDLSRFVLDAVRLRMIDEASAEAKRATTDMSETEVMDLIDEALEWARSDEGRKLSARRS